MSSVIPLFDRDGAVVAHATVDSDDGERIGVLRWHLHTQGYAARKDRGRRVFMHRFILGLAFGDRRVVDHINGDKLDNRRANIRVCTHAQNMQNLRPRAGGSSTYRGVFFNRRLGRWVASATLNYRTVHLGCFDSEIEAAAVAAGFRAHHMEFACEKAAA